MSNMSLSRADFVALLIRVSVLGAFSYFSVKYLIDIIDPTKKQKKEAQDKAEKLLSRLGIDNVKLSLSEYELSIAAQLVDPQSIDVCWTDIAGLTDVIEDIKATIILPLRTPELFSMSKLHQAPKGVLLHGPPGCGKTMIAKATAKEAGARFINLEVPALTDKWYGESQKLAAAVFTLAIKLQPCIIFIDEIDSFLRSRDTHDHEATAMMKAQFMILWDGLVSSKHCKVIVMGATNRPQDVDKAILRRMPAMFKVNLPTKLKRTEILELILNNENLANDLIIDEIANLTEGFSGSDLNELCRGAAMVRVRDYCTQNLNTNNESICELRGITMKDFLTTIEKMKHSKTTLSGQTMGLALD